MKVTSLIISLLFLTGIRLSQAQNHSIPIKRNLIINPSLEDYELCPVSYSTKMKIEIIPGWTSPNSGTPDYYNECSDEKASVPENWSGYANARDGKGYLGFYLFRPREYYEYLQGKLKAPLTIGKLYKINFHLATSLYSEFRPEKIGLLLIDGQLHMDTSNNVDSEIMRLNKNQGQYFELKIEYTDEEWTRVELSFTADREYTSLIIGHFNDHIELTPNPTWYEQEPMLKGAAYVLVDDFKLFELNEETTNPSLFVLSDINFEYNSATLLKEGKLQLDSLYFEILLESKKTITITGHTDDIGSEEFNTILSLDRAKSVKAYLNFLGMPASQIRCFGAGKSQPMYPNEDETHRAKNRRVEIEY